RHVPGWHREVFRVMLADPEEVHPGLLGEHALVDDVTDRLGMGHRLAVGVAVPVAEGVQPEGIGHDMLLASSRTGSLRTGSSRTGSLRTARSNSGRVSTT